jgi:hypothetical protein
MFRPPVPTQPNPPLVPGSRVTFAVIGLVLAGTGTVYDTGHTKAWRSYVQPRVAFILDAGEGTEDGTEPLDVRVAAEHLENIRRVLHPPVADLAALFEVSRQAIYKWLAGTSIPEEAKLGRIRTLSQVADRVHVAGIARAGTLLTMKAFNGRSLMDLIRCGENRDEHLDRLITEARAMERAYGRSGLATTRSRPTRDWQSDISIPGSAERT